MVRRAVDPLLHGHADRVGHPAVQGQDLGGPVTHPIVLQALAGGELGHPFVGDLVQRRVDVAQQEDGGDTTRQAVIGAGDTADGEEQGGRKDGGTTEHRGRIAPDDRVRAGSRWPRAPNRRLVT
jgi:hypothetical protein